MESRAVRPILAATGALMLAACTALHHPSAASKGESRPLTIVQTQDFASLNPIFVSGVGGQELAALLYSYLLRIDDRGNLVPDAALRVPTRANGGISPDGRTITYRLRAGLRFSDGVALTSRDVAFTMRAITDPRNAVPSVLGFDRIRAIETPDARTVRVVLKTPFAPALVYLCGPGNAVPILPEHILGRQGPLAQAPFDAKPVGSGPYRVVRWQRGERLELERNSTYWGRAAHIERMAIVFTASAPAAETMLRAGEADAYVNADESQYALLKKLPGTRVDRIPIDGTGALIFNLQDPVTSDPVVRRAFAMAFDGRDVVGKVLQGGVFTAGPGQGLFQWAYDPRAFSMPRYDPAAAARALDADGWRLDPQGVRAKGSRRLAVTLITRADKPSATTIATAIQAAERAIGVDVSIQRFAVDELVAPAPAGPLYGGRFGVTLFQFIAGFDPDVTDQFACDRIPPRGFNKARYCNPRVDALLERAASAPDRAARIRLYREVQRLLAHDLPLVALYQATSINVFPRALRGQTTAVTTPFWNVAAWRLAP
ncbi:MAG TPA: peptide ABC transporter substrate-binding protein [Candidatus Baltobacteraceae bacterium]|jgi:peptide/nickel transport system substrate-binding protein